MTSGAIDDRVKFGAVFPHDIDVVRGDQILELFAAIEQVGFDYVMVFDHVAGAPLEDLRHLPVVPYVDSSPFYEILVLLGFAAAATTSLELVTGVLVLPQRQTVLAAKQLATIDILSDERLRVGLGVGWNPAEYEALGGDFGARGVVLDEQVEVLRALWEGPPFAVQRQFHRWHTIGIAPAPRRRIPLWFGGSSPPALRRVARCGDGWIPPMMDAFGRAPDLDGLLRTLDRELGEAGRGRHDIGLEGRARWDGDDGGLRAAVDQWRARGADRVVVSVALLDDRSPAAYIDAFGNVAEALR